MLSRWLIDSVAFKNSSYAGVSAAGIAQPVKKKRKKKDKLASHSAKEEFTKGLNEGRVFVSDGSFWVVCSLEALWEGSRETSTCNTNTATC